MFKEEAAREEKKALENIAAILADLTSKKTAMVSKASRNIRDSSIQDRNRLQREMSNMQKVSSDARQELNKYAEKAGRHFMESTFSVAESKTIMEIFLQECSTRVDYSKQQWENAHSHINNLNKSSRLEMESTVKGKISGNGGAHEKFLYASSAMDTDFEASASDLMDAVDDTLMQDQKRKKEMDSMISLCLDQLKSIQERHGESVSNVRSKAEKWLTKDYFVDLHTGATPERRAIEVPSLASIEDMRNGF